MPASSEVNLDEVAWCFFSASTFKEVGWFWQNNARLFEKGKLIPGCHFKTKYLVVLPLLQLPRACEDPLLTIFGWQCAAAKLLTAVLSTEHLLCDRTLWGHSMEPIAIRWQPQGGIVRSGPVEDGLQPQEAIHDLYWAGPRQSQSTVRDLLEEPSSGAPKKPRGDIPGGFLKW